MIIGVPKEIKNHEYRVAVVPSGVHQMVKQGHKVIVETNAGQGSGFSDQQYLEEGAEIAQNAEEVFAKAEMIVKVKEPLSPEFPMIKPTHIVFTYFHFASSRDLTESMMKTGAVCIAYETVETADKQLPLLTPMSEVAGRLSIQEGAKYLERPFGGRGVLLGGVPGVVPAKVVVIGGGIVGTNAAKMAAGLGARVIILDISVDRLRYLNDVMPPNVVTLMSNEYNIQEQIADADLVVGAVLIHGARAPKLITRDMLKLMKPGSVITDVSIDQGGCIETSKPTTHSDPIYEVDGVIHYCVANMPGAVSRTSTFALTNVTLPYAIKIADQGFPAGLQDPALAKGLNMVGGKITYQPVAEAFDLEFTPLKDAIG